MELNIGIICASLPTLRAFLVKFFPQTFRSSSIAYAPGQGYNSDRSGRRQLVEQEHAVQNSGDIIINNETDVDIEKARPTFLASDSEKEVSQQPPMMQLR